MCGSYPFATKTISRVRAPILPFTEFGGALRRSERPLETPIHSGYRCRQVSGSFSSIGGRCRGKTISLVAFCIAHSRNSSLERLRNYWGGSANKFYGRQRGALVG